MAQGRNMWQRRDIAHKLPVVIDSVRLEVPHIGDILWGDSAGDDAASRRGIWRLAWP